MEQESNLNNNEIEKRQNLINEKIISNKYIYLILFLGGLIHLIFDTMMYMWDGLGIYWLFPLQSPEFVFSFHLFWPGSLLPNIIVSILLGIIGGIELIIQGYIHFVRNKK